MLACSDGQVLDKGDLHRGDCAEHVPGRVGSVESIIESAHQYKDECVKGNHCNQQSKKL